MDMLYRQVKVIYILDMAGQSRAEALYECCLRIGSAKVIMAGPRLRSIRDRARADARSTPLNVFSPPTLVSCLSFPFPSMI